MEKSKAKAAWFHLFRLGMGFLIAGVAFLVIGAVATAVALILPGDDWWPLWLGLLAIGGIFGVLGVIFTVISAPFK